MPNQVIRVIAGVRTIPLKEKNRMKKVYVDSTDYCEEAKLDTQQLRNLVKLSSEQNIFVSTNNICQADLIIYRACGHLQAQQDESISDIKELLRLKNSKAKLIVWGCLSKINPASLREVYNGPLIGPEEAWDFFYRFLSLSKKKKNDVTANSLNIHYMYKQTRKEQPSQIEKTSNLYNYFESQLSRLVDFRKKLLIQNRWYIKIVSGCKNNCTYCSDRLAYKTVRSVPIEKIVKQFELGLSKGYRCFFMVGRDLGSYGYDIGTTLADLLDKINERNHQTDYKIYLNNVSPNSLIALYPELERKKAFKNIVHLASHIQSGSDRILKLMGKNLSLVQWVEIIKHIQKKYPKIELKTSIMVGFPTETDHDFAESINLLHDVLFDKVIVYKYNERPNLPSLKIKNRIPESIKTKRYNQTKYHKTVCRIKKRLRRPQFFTITDLGLLINMTSELLHKRARSYSRNVTQ